MRRPMQETVAKVSLAAFKPNESKNIYPPLKKKNPSLLPAMFAAICPPTTSDVGSAFTIYSIQIPDVIPISVIYALFGWRLALSG